MDATSYKHWPAAPPSIRADGGNDGELRLGDEVDFIDEEFRSYAVPATACQYNQDPCTMIG
jgi:hypothetical protein